jgi:uncharacterized protein
MQRYAADGRPLPVITPVTAPFFEAATRGELVMQCCERDGPFFYPRARCPRCLGDDWAWVRIDPAGTLYSFTIDHEGQDPHQRPFAPLVVALVELDAGPRIVGQLEGVPVDEISIGGRVTVDFELIEGVPLIRFRPAGAQQQVG